MYINLKKSIKQQLYINYRQLKDILVVILELKAQKHVVPVFIEHYNFFLFICQIYLFSNGITFHSQ